MAFDRNYKDSRILVDLSKAKALLNWEPKVALGDGLKETVAYFRRSLELS